MGPSGTATYGYNGLDSRVSAVDASGTRTFQRDGAYVTDPVLGDGQATYTPAISERRGGMSQWLHSGLKNADSRTITSSGISATRTYDAFGNVVASTGTWNGAFGYAGAFGYQEDPSGLKLLGHRYYDSSIGMFISRDPVYDGRNWFSYCANKPTTSVDASGTVVWFLVAAVVAVSILAIENTAVGPYDDISQEEADRNLAEWKVDAISNIPIGPFKGRAGAGAVGRQGLNNLKRAAPSIASAERSAAESAATNVRHPRVKAAKLRKIWEDANQMPWPVDEDGRNYDVSHKKALADGGDNSLDNIAPMKHKDHVKMHSLNGDFARWAKRRKVKIL